MNLVITLDCRFVRTPDHRVWTLTNYDRSFWDRYLRVFDGVKIVARAQPKVTVDEKYHRVDGQSVEFVEVPYYLGPWQYLTVRQGLRKVIQSAANASDAVLCRVPSRLGTDLIDYMWKSARPYGLEVIGDPYEALGPGAVRHILRPFFRYSLTRSLKQQCARASAASYVTGYALQKRYQPLTAGCSFPISDIDLRSEDMAAAPRVFGPSCANEAFKNAPDNEQGNRRLVFVGSLAQMYKAPDVLMQAVHLLHRRGFAVKLAILGDGRHRPEMEQLAQSLSLDGSVKFLGQLPAGGAVRAELDRATVMVMPSRTEGLPKALIEAMARALPCVATNVGGIPELLDAEDMVPPNDANALAAKLQEVLSNPERLTRMSAHNLAKAQEYRSEVLENKRSEFYRHLRKATEAWLANRKLLPAYAATPRPVKQALQ